MSSDGLSRLCRLVDVSLHRHKEVVELVELSRDQERTLLISLSKVLRQIQGRIAADNPDITAECYTSVCENHQCLTFVIDTLISFLTVESKYVHHLVGNILVVVSKFIAGAVCNEQTNWKSFIDRLCIFFEVAFHNALLHSSVTQIEPSKCDPLSPTALHMGFKKSNWRTVAEILQILRSIIKDLEEEENDNDVENLEVLVSSVTMCFAKLPWNKLDASLTHGILVDQVISSKSSLIDATVTESTIIFLGSLVQLFCSLVKTVRGNEGLPTSNNKHSLLQTIETIVPQLSEWCLAKEWIQHDMHILPYFQHKILMLMSRLGSQMLTCCNTVLLWLQLVHKFYGDILTKPISLMESDQDCLEGSPFLWSLSNQENNCLSACHLQRHSIFLFLRLSMCLIVHQESNGVTCTCGTEELISKSGSKTVEKCNATRKCILEFNEWLQFQFPFNRSSENEIYSQKCMDFSSSFINLYIHEDDLLFEVLLHMFNVATYADKHYSRTYKDEGASRGANDDSLIYISELFNPVLVFHAFLAELQYDHQLLLDYLISKDSGTRCAEYLLKCLRKVCDSWKIFVEIGLELENDGKQLLKKQKFSLEQSQFSASNKVHNKDDHPQSNTFGPKSLYFVKAKTCMLTLKTALEKLHKRSLFPYNPEVLLRRLKKFEELCG